MKFSAKKEHEDLYVFVSGDTKFLRDCNQEELKILYNNGRTDLIEVKNDNSEESLPNTVTELPNETIQEAAPVAQDLEETQTTSTSTRRR